MTTYRLSIEVTTDADPSSLLDTLQSELAPQLEDYLGEDVSIDDNSACVEEIQW